MDNQPNYWKERAEKAEEALASQPNAQEVRDSAIDEVADRIGQSEATAAVPPNEYRAIAFYFAKMARAMKSMPISKQAWPFKTAGNFQDMCKQEPSAEVKLAVWYGSLPESNGKTNWTAILHSGDICKGHTIAQSEYPERVRYEADRVRFLIGELEEAPFILDYDADKCSAAMQAEQGVKP